MKKIVFILIFSLLLCISCSQDNDLEIKKVTFSLKFSHNWNDSIPVSVNDFNEIKFENENGDSLSITRLRYLVSDLTFFNSNGDTLNVDDYALIDLSNDESFTFTLSERIPIGTYNRVTFTFGFDEENNIGGAYPDLNVASFEEQVSPNGGYHFMQFDGKYLNEQNTESPFNYHMITAVDNSDANNVVITNTSFEVNLGQTTLGANTILEVEANLAEWFKTPNTWNLNELNTGLMTNYDAQLLMSANGRNVFSLAD